MTPYREPEIIKQITYLLFGLVGGFISIVYGLLIGKKHTILSSIAKIIIGGFVGRGAGVITNDTLVASFSGVISLEIMHIIKEQGPELMKKKLEKYFK